MKRYEKSLFLSDIHAPYEDDKSMKVVREFSEWFKPQKVFILGDLVDFYQLSRFSKDPKRMDHLQDDIDCARACLEQIRTANPKATIWLFEGNHETRLRRWLWDHPEISSLRSLTIHELLTLHQYDVHWVPGNDRFIHHGIYLEHGDVIRQQSAYTARAMLDRRGVSGLSGHTHRMGSHYLTNMGGDFVWIENGCLCSRSPEYAKSPNWQNGFSVGYFRDERFTLSQICIPDGKAVFAGKEFGSI